MFDDDRHCEYHVIGPVNLCSRSKTDRSIELLCKPLFLQENLTYLFQNLILNFPHGRQGVSNFVRTSNSNIDGVVYCSTVLT